MFAVVRRGGKEKRTGGEDRGLVRGRRQQRAAAHRGRLPAVVPLRVPDPPGRAIRERHQPRHHRVRGERHHQQLAHASQTGAAAVRLPPAEALARRVRHEERGHRVHVPRGRVGRQRCRLRRRTRPLIPLVRGSRGRAALNPVPEATSARPMVLNGLARLDSYILAEHFG